ncbi:MAG: ABC transporter substrate-binding protein, partial [Alphaproteobacteria bacterium]
MLVSPAKANDRVDESMALIDRLIGHINMVISNDPSEEEVLKETNYIIDNYFDYDLVARFSAGQAWRSASDEEREAYKIAFRQVMLNLAKTQFKSLATLEYSPKQAVPKGDRLVVASGIIHDKTGEFADATISWRVSTKANQPVKIID